MSEVSIDLDFYTGDNLGVREAFARDSGARAVAFRREDFKQATEMKAELFENGGAYVLFSPDRLIARVGKAEELGKRLRTHSSNAAGKDATKYEYWDQTVILTADRNINAAEAAYLESCLTQRAKVNPLWLLEAGQEPHLDAGRLNPRDKRMADKMVGSYVLICSVLGLGIFEQTRRRKAGSDASNTSLPSPDGSNSGIVFDYEGKGFSGKLEVLTGESPILLSGSKLRLKLAESMPAKAREMRDQLSRNGLLRDEGGSLLLGQDVPVSSVSLAASMVSGTSVNGRSAWKASTGQTYGEWDDARNVAT